MTERKKLVKDSILATCLNPDCPEDQVNILKFEGYSDGKVTYVGRCKTCGKKLTATFRKKLRRMMILSEPTS